jgi:hypothetical protein
MYLLRVRQINKGEKDNDIQSRLLRQNTDCPGMAAIACLTDVSPKMAGWVTIRDKRQDRSTNLTLKHNKSVS